MVFVSNLKNVDSIFRLKHVQNSFFENRFQVLQFKLRFENILHYLMAIIASLIGHFLPYLQL